MTGTPAETAGLTLEEMPWPGDVEPPSSDLPYDDGEPMESPWRFGSAALLLASYTAARDDVIFELLSPSAEDYDLTQKKQIYEQIFRTTEYFCIAPQAERLPGWRLERGGYVASAPRPNASAPTTWQTGLPPWKLNLPACAEVLTSPDNYAPTP